jgi:uncharacterized membrane protein YkvA (DUF1232 family)
LGWSLARTPELSRRRKWPLLAGALYSLSPVDLVPGIVPVLGQLDDMAALLYGIRAALRHAPPEVAARLLAAAGLSEEQIDADLQSLGIIALGFSATVARRLWRGGRVAGRFLALGAAEARAGWQAHRERAARRAGEAGSAEAMPRRAAGPAGENGIRRRRST